MALWATAVAAADRVHSSKQVQEGLIGACSAIRCPWPALPALLETALPGQPVERVLPCYCPCPVLTCRADMTDAHMTDTKRIGKLALRDVVGIHSYLQNGMLSLQNSWHCVHQQCCIVSTAMLCGPDCAVARHLVPCLHVSIHANQPGANGLNSIRSAAIPF